MTVGRQGRHARRRCCSGDATDDPHVQLLRLPDAVQPAAQRAVEGAAGADDQGRRVLALPGAQFRIVTIDLEPNEPLDKLARMKANVHRPRCRPAARPGRGRAGRSCARRPPVMARRSVASRIPSVSSTCIVADRAEWAHPAALIFLSTTGAVTRYVYGIEFAPGDDARVDRARPAWPSPRRPSAS